MNRPASVPITADLPSQTDTPKVFAWHLSIQYRILPLDLLPESSSSSMGVIALALLGRSVLYFSAISATASAPRNSHSLYHTNEEGCVRHDRTGLNRIAKGQNMIEREWTYFLFVSA